mgnify:CR=1 FL=1
MKVNIDMENLSNAVEIAITENANNVIKDVIEKKISTYIDKNYKKIIEITINEKMEEYLKNYLETTTITVGEGLLNQNIKTYTIQEYINKQISDIMNNKKFETEIKNRWGEKSFQEVSFDEFIKQSFDVSKEVRHQLENYMKSVKDDINRNIKNVTDQVMKDMLSNTIFEILMQSDTYSKISNGLKISRGLKSYG